MRSIRPGDPCNGPSPRASGGETPENVMRQIVAAAFLALTFGTPVAALAIDVPASFCIFCPW